MDTSVSHPARMELARGGQSGGEKVVQRPSGNPPIATDSPPTWKLVETGCVSPDTFCFRRWFLVDFE